MRRLETKGERRERKRLKERRHRVSGRSLFVLLRAALKRAGAGK